MTPQIQLLHSVEYQLRIANYRETKDGQKNRNPPYPLELPGYGPYESKNKEIKYQESNVHEEVEDLFFSGYSDDIFAT